VTDVGFALLGHGFMGAAHSRALHALRVLGPAARPALVSACGRDLDALAAFRGRYGWQHAVTDWHEPLADARVDVFDNAAPNHLHLEPTLAAIRNRKHVLVEKPLDRTAREARRLWLEAERAGVVHMCGFNLRFLPAVRLARELIERGELGEVTHFRARFLASSALRSDQGRTWRFDRECSGSGAIADLGSHLIDTARCVAGEVAAVAAVTRTFVGERDHERVDVDDAFAAVVEFEDGAVGTLEASRAAGRRSNEFAFEVDGTSGSLAFDIARLNELELVTERKRPRRIDVTDPSDPFMADYWWPAPGHAIGWGDSFVHELGHLIAAVAGTASVRPLGADFEDGYRCAEVCDAILRAAGSGRREAVEYRTAPSEAVTWRGALDDAVEGGHAPREELEGRGALSEAGQAGGRSA
jgi:predicted dehydrogenase